MNRIKKILARPTKVLELFYRRKVWPVLQNMRVIKNHRELKRLRRRVFELEGYVTKLEIHNKALTMEIGERNEDHKTVREYRHDHGWNDAIEAAANEVRGAENPKFSNSWNDACIFLLKRIRALRSPKEVRCSKLCNSPRQDFGCLWAVLYYGLS